MMQGKLHLFPLGSIVRATKGFKGSYWGGRLWTNNDLCLLPGDSMSLSYDYRHGVNFCALGPYYYKAYFSNSCSIQTIYITTIQSCNVATQEKLDEYDYYSNILSFWTIEDVANLWLKVLWDGGRTQLFDLQ